MLTGLLLLAAISACSLLETDLAPAPAYVYVPSVTFYTDTIDKSDKNYEGANTSRIKDAWLYNSGGLLGAAIGLPALVPVQVNGADSIDLRVEAGVLRSGQDDQRIPYPLMQPYTRRIRLIPGRVDTIYPDFTYYRTRQFAFIEDFDRPGFRFAINPHYRYPGDTVMAVNDARALAPGNSGMFAISRNNTRFQILTTDQYVLPGMNLPVFLELDYHTNLPLEVGYYYDDPKLGPSAADSVISLYPNSSWNKVYVSLNEEIAPHQQAGSTAFKFYIGVYNPDSIEPAVFIDNIKLVYLD